MLSLFPTLLAYQLLAPFLLRLTLGVIFLFWAYKRFRGFGSTKSKGIAIIEVIVGILLILGLYTQLAALIAFIIMAIQILRKIKNRAFLTDGVNYYYILLIISASLLFLGAGAFSFDLPL